MSITNLDEKSKLLSALANATRLRVLLMIDDNEVNVTDMAKQLNISQSALSQHLAVLRTDDLVSTRREAQTIYYSTKHAGVRKILMTLRDIYSRTE